MQEITPNSNNEKNNEGLSKSIYGLYLLGFIFGFIPSLIAIILNHAKVDDVKGTWLESHFRYQMRTFYYGLLWSIIGVILTFVYVGLLIIFANFIWMLYRYIKGLLNILDKKEMYQK